MKAANKTEDDTCVLRDVSNSGQLAVTVPTYLQPYGSENVMSLMTITRLYRFGGCEKVMWLVAVKRLCRW